MCSDGCTPMADGDLQNQRVGLEEFDSAIEKGLISNVLRCGFTQHFGKDPVRSRELRHRSGIWLFGAAITMFVALITWHARGQNPVATFAQNVFTSFSAVCIFAVVIASLVLVVDQGKTADEFENCYKTLAVNRWFRAHGWLGNWKCTAFKSDTDLIESAHEAFCDGAFEVETLRRSGENQKADILIAGEFKTVFDAARKLGLIDSNSGYDPYFAEARKRLAEKEGEKKGEKETPVV